MNNTFAFGLLVGGVAVLVGAAIFKSKNSTKYAEVNYDAEPPVEEDPVKEDPKTFKEKLEETVINVATKAVEQKERIEAITTVITLFTAVVTFKNALTKGRKTDATTRVIIFKPGDTDDELDKLISELKSDRRILA